MALSPPAALPDASGLQRLLALEAQLERKLAAARAEAEQIRAEAERLANAALESGAVEGAVEQAALLARIEAERARASEELRRGQARQVARYRQLSPARIEAVARGLLERLLDAPGETASL